MEKNIEAAVKLYSGDRPFGLFAQRLYKNLSNMNFLFEQIKDVFEQWHLDGAIPSITLEGYTFQTLVNQFGMKPVGAFITLDWLKREPEKAARALEKGIR